MRAVRLTAPLAALTLSAVAANAGGYTPPVVETGVVAPVVETVPVGDWAGGYAGLTLGYAFGGDDKVGLHDEDGFAGDIGELKLKGANAGVRAGYRWQRNNWVFGPELGFEGGNIKDSFSGSDEDLSASFEGKIKNVLALRFKTGYTVRPDTLVYGIVGVARADVDYTLRATDGTFSGSLKENIKRTGYILGLGVEKQINEKLSVTGEYEYANFGKEHIGFGDLTTAATPKYNNVKVGLNFKF